jgi:hypothetical protein
MSQPPSDDDRGNKPPASRYSAWVIGGALILLGVIFILRNVMGFELNNWWALFILIPSFGALASAYAIYERSGRRLTVAARGPLMGGIILLLVTAIFLFNLDWGKVWPLFIIIAGVTVLVTSLGPRS